MTRPIPRLLGYAAAGAGVAAAGYVGLVTGPAPSTSALVGGSDPCRRWEHEPLTALDHPC
jgi:hypothetical protein